MKQMFDAARLTEFLTKAGLIAALAAALLMPTTVRLHGSEMSPDAPFPPKLRQTASDLLPLPPIPYLETMPWLLQSRGERGFKIDTLLAPKFEMLAPALAQPIDRDRPLSPSQLSFAGAPGNG